MNKVYVGVGHGGTDCGAVGNGFEEEDLTLAVANACTTYLTANGVTVKQSRNADVTFPTGDKVKDANAWDADLILDIHINAGGGKGTEVYHTVNGGVSKTLAQNILDSIISATGETNRGLKTKKQADGRDYFGIIRDTKAPAVLVECCFIDTTDIQHIDTSAEQVIFGQAIAKGILNTLGIIPDPEQVKPVSTTYCVSAGGISTKGEAETIKNKIEALGYIGKIEEEK